MEFYVSPEKKIKGC